MLSVVRLNVIILSGLAPNRTDISTSVRIPCRMQRLLADLRVAKCRFTKWIIYCSFSSFANKSWKKSASQDFGAKKLSRGPIL